jgi:hypothetical protein
MLNSLAIYQQKGIQGLRDLEGKFALVIFDGSPAATFPRHWWCRKWQSHQQFPSCDPMVATKQLKYN